MTKQMEKYFNKYIDLVRSRNFIQIHEVFPEVSLPMKCKYDFILNMKDVMHGINGTIITRSMCHYNYSFIYGFMYRYRYNVYFCFVRSSDRKHRFVTSSIITPIVVKRLIEDGIITEEFAYE